MNRATPLLLTVLAALALAPAVAAQPTYDLRLQTRQLGSRALVTVQMRSSTGLDAIGTSNLVLTYDEAALRYDPGLGGLLFHALAGGLYLTPGVAADPVAGGPDRLSVNVVLDVPGAGQLIPAVYTDVVTLPFTVLQPGGLASVAWDPAGSVVYGADEATLWAPAGGGREASSPAASAALQVAVEGRDVVLSWDGARRAGTGYAVELKGPEGSAYGEVARVRGDGAAEGQPHGYTLRGLPYGTYTVRVRPLDGGAVVGEVEVTLAMAEAYALEAVYPNPFTEQATVVFAVREAGPVRVALYDVLGRLVATPYDGTPEAGETVRVRLDGAALAAGTYVLRLSGEGFAATRRLTRLR